MRRKTPNKNTIENSCIETYSCRCFNSLSNDRKSMFKSGDSRVVWAWVWTLKYFKRAARYLHNVIRRKPVKIYFVAPIPSAAASCIKPLASCIYLLVNQWKATLRNDVGFPTVYRRIYCRKFMTLSNQTSRCICKCIRMNILLMLLFSKTLRTAMTLRQRNDVRKFTVDAILWRKIQCKKRDILMF